MHIRSIKTSIIKSIFAISLAVMMILSIVGCAQQHAPEAPTYEIATLSPTNVNTPVEGGRLVLPLMQGDVVGNPLLVVTQESFSISKLLFESLVTLDEYGEPQPYLAESWTVDDGGRQWSLTLRPNITWHHNGRALNAQDVIFTLDMLKEIADSADEEPQGETTEDEQAQGPRGSSYAHILQYLSSWEAGDEGQVRLHTKQSFYGILHLLNFPILPFDAGYTASSAPNNLPGSGPYQVISNQGEQGMQLNFYEQWWRSAPYIKEIQVQYFDSTDAAVSSLLLKQVDAVQSDALTVSQYRETGDANLHEYASSQLEYLILNSISPDLANVDIRQAVAHALDKLEIASSVYVNHAIVTDTPILPDSWLYNEKIPIYENDTQRAKSLVRQSAWQDTDEDGRWDLSPDGVKRSLALTILTNVDDTPLHRDAALIIAEQLRRVGIEASVTALGWEQYVQALQQRSFDIALVGANMSASGDLSMLVHTQGDLNFGRWSDEQLDGALQDALDAPDRGLYMEKVAQVQQLIAEKLCIIPLFFRSKTLLSAYDVRGVTGVSRENIFGGINHWYFSNEK